MIQGRNSNLSRQALPGLSAVLGLLALLTAGSCGEPDTFLKDSIELKSYPSGSGAVFVDGRLCLIGDDAKQVFVGDAGFRQTDSIPLYTHPEPRIPKELKADLEAAADVTSGTTPEVLLLGSGSMDPHRNAGWLIQPGTGRKTELSMAAFYSRVRAAGIAELNIEGATAAAGAFLLTNRGNKSHPGNHLILTAPRFWESPDTAPIRLIEVAVKTDTASFSGVSGADYARGSDRLFLTVSTEDTYSAHADGAIGKSYLWIIDGFSKRMQEAAIRPDHIIDLAAMDQRFAGHKVESVCVVSDKAGKAELILVADDDRGTTLLYRVRLGDRGKEDR